MVTHKKRKWITWHVHYRLFKYCETHNFCSPFIAFWCPKFLHFRLINTTLMSLIDTRYPLFLRVCWSHKIRKLKGTQKIPVPQYAYSYWHHARHKITDCMGSRVWWKTFSLYHSTHYKREQAWHKKTVYQISAKLKGSVVFLTLWRQMHQ